MFPSINHVSLTGKLVADARYNITKERQIPVTNFRIENTRDYSTSEHKPKSERLTAAIVCWLKLAESCKNLKAGDVVYIEGSLKSRQIETGSTLEVLARSVQMKHDDENIIEDVAEPGLQDKGY